MNPTIHVIATTFDGTEAALRAAMPAAIQQNERVARLAATLRRREFEVVFVGCNSGRPRMRSGVHAHA